MIQISKKADYSFVVLSFLANRHDRPTLSAKQLALSTGLPIPMTAKIIKLLTRKKILNSEQGSKGGYRLSRNPKKISLFEILEAVEGPLAFTKCTQQPSIRCKTINQCPLRPHWIHLNKVFHKVFKNVSLGEMLGPPSASSKKD